MVLPYKIKTRTIFIYTPDIHYKYISSWLHWFIFLNECQHFLSVYRDFSNELRGVLHMRFCDLFAICHADVRDNLFSMPSDLLQCNDRLGITIDIYDRWVIRLHPVFSVYLAKKTHKIVSLLNALASLSNWLGICSSVARFFWELPELLANRLDGWRHTPGLFTQRGEKSSPLMAK